MPGKGHINYNKEEIDDPQRKFYTQEDVSLYLKKLKDLGYVIDFITTRGHGIKYDAYKIIKDFDSSLSIGTHCYEKKWYWWHPISNLQNQRVTVIVTDASKTGGSSINNYYFSNQYKPAYHESTGIENFAVDFSIDG